MKEKDWLYRANPLFGLPVYTDNDKMIVNESPISLQKGIASCIAKRLQY